MSNGIRPVLSRTLARSISKHFVRILQAVGSSVTLRQFIFALMPFVCKHQLDGCSLDHFLLEYLIGISHAFFWKKMWKFNVQTEIFYQFWSILRLLNFCHVCSRQSSAFVSSSLVFSGALHYYFFVFLLSSSSHDLCWNRLSKSFSSVMSFLLFNFLSCINSFHQVSCCT